MNFKHNFYFAVFFFCISASAHGKASQVYEQQHIVVTAVQTSSDEPSQIKLERVHSEHKEIQSQVIPQNQEYKSSEHVILPTEFKAKSSGKAGWFGTHRFQIDTKEGQGNAESDSLNGKQLKQRFWALRTVLMLTDRSLSSSLGVAYSSWFFWRTFNVFDENDVYVGQINKHWFTWFSGAHRYDIRDRDGKTLATARREDVGAFAEIVMRSANKDYRYNQVVARFKVPREYNAYLDENNDYLAWNVKIEDHDQKFFSEQHLDPRILTMFVPFVSSKDYNWK